MCVCLMCAFGKFAIPASFCIRFPRNFHRIDVTNFVISLVLLLRVDALKWIKNEGSFALFEYSFYVNVSTS